MYSYKLPDTLDTQQPQQENIIFDSSFSQTKTEDFSSRVSSKIAKLKNIAQNIDRNEKDLLNKAQEALNHKEQKMLQSLEAKFEEYQAILNKKKQSMKDEICCNFSKKRNRLESYPEEDLGSVLAWKNKIQRKIADCENTKTMVAGHDILVEDENHMNEDIKHWVYSVENFSQCKNIENFVDRSNLKLSDSFERVAESLGQYEIEIGKTVFEQILSFSNEKKPNELQRDLRVEGSKRLTEEVFKAYDFSTDTNAQETGLIRIIPKDSLIQSKAAKEKLKSHLLETIHNLKPNCFDMKPKTLNRFTQALSHFCNLKSLNLTLEFGEKLTDSTLDILSNFLPNLTSLESFSLALHSDCSKLTFVGLCNLVSGIKNSVNFSQISLMISSLPGISEENFLQSLQLIFTNPRLQNVKLIIPATPTISDDGLSQLAQWIIQSHHLRGLELYFMKGEHLTDKGFIQLAEGLQTLENLEFLHFIIGDKIPKVTDRGFASLIQAISKIQKLNSLRIELPEARITNEAISLLSNTLVSKHFFLKELGLNFAWSLISDSALVDLSQCLSELMYLESFHINLQACSVMNEGFIFLIKDGVSRLSLNLRQLSLNVSWCKGITDEGVSVIANELNNLKKLEKLILRFEESRMITEKGVLKLCEGIINLSNLEYIQLYVINCGRDFAGDKSKKKLEQILSAKNLTRNIWIG